MTQIFIVFGTQSCPYCKRAVELVNSKPRSAAVYVDINKDPRMRDPAWKTVPQIFTEGNHIGGYEDLEQYFSQQEAA